MKRGCLTWSWNGTVWKSQQALHGHWLDKKMFHHCSGSVITQLDRLCLLLAGLYSVGTIWIQHNTKNCHTLHGKTVVPSLFRKYNLITQLDCLCFHWAILQLEQPGYNTTQNLSCIGKTENVPSLFGKFDRSAWPSTSSSSHTSVGAT